LDRGHGLDFRGANDGFLVPLGNCLGAPAGLFTDADTNDSVIANGQAFSDLAMGAVLNEAVIDTTTDRQDQLFALLHKPTATGCFTRTGDQLLKQRIMPVQAGRVHLPSMGDDSVAVRLAEGVISGVRTDYVYLDVVFVRVANTAVVLTFFSARTPAGFSADSKPIARSTEEQVAHLAVNQLDRARSPQVSAASASRPRPSPSFVPREGTIVGTRIARCVVDSDGHPSAVVTAGAAAKRPFYGYLYVGFRLGADRRWHRFSRRVRYIPDGHAGSVHASAAFTWRAITTHRPVHCTFGSSMTPSRGSSSGPST
jgi:hypothetical protein